MDIKKRNGSLQAFQASKLRRVLDQAARDLGDVETENLLIDVEVGLYDGMPSSEVAALLLDAALAHLQDDPGYSPLAARILLFDLYKQVLGKASFADLTEAHRSSFAEYIEKGISRGLVHPRMGEAFDIPALAAKLQPERDLAFRYNGLFALAERYLIKDLMTGELLEVPQFLWMRVAMGVCLKEDDPTGCAARFYDAMSSLRYLPSTPTLFNAGTPSSQLSSCFLMEAQDSMEAIGKSLCDIMQLAKYAGGIGTSITKLRATGSVIRSINGRSSGPIPFVKMMDAVISGVDQGGRRRGTLAVYCEPWHCDIERFLDLKQRAGDESQRAHTLNTAVFLNDEFLARVEADDSWTLFDPAETPDLAELYGTEFSERYRHYVQEARTGRIRTFRTMRARDLFHRMLKSLVETSHPWLTFKDAGNLRCPISNAGVVHSSNLCTEIFLPTDQENVAVCNLASIVLPRHLDGDGKVDWDALQQSARLAVRQLDDVIDANFYAIPEAQRANFSTRPVGLGLMGWSDLLEKMGLPFDGAGALDLLDRLVEFISWHAIDASADLARSRGTFPAFKGSDWSRGVVPIDTIARLESHRKTGVTAPSGARMDWQALRKKVAGGMRNGTVMAVAPTATISLIAGTSQSIEPPFALVYSRNNISGKFLEVNENLVARLKLAGVWEEACEEILLYRGELGQIAAVPGQVKAVFKTAYEVAPETLVAQAAVVQKWVDQGVSRNMYLPSKDTQRLAGIYLQAWRAGLKSTYYAFPRPSMRAEATYAYDDARPKAHLSASGHEGNRSGASRDSTGMSGEMTPLENSAAACASALEGEACEACQ